MSSMNILMPHMWLAALLLVSEVPNPISVYKVRRQEADGHLFSTVVSEVQCSVKETFKLNLFC